MRWRLGLALVIVTALGWPGRPPAADRIHVVATINDLRLLAEAVGGDLVETDTLARPAQNPDDLEVRPSHMAKVRRADLLVINGLDVDAWVEAIVVGANNPKVVPGAPGRVDLSLGIPVLEVPTVRVDRSMGDVHPAGNPHYYLDPGPHAAGHRRPRGRAGPGGPAAPGRPSRRDGRNSLRG
jgi:zinc/manganese transport system substrate-binding protein